MKNYDEYLNAIGQEEVKEKNPKMPEQSMILPEAPEITEQKKAHKHFGFPKKMAYATLSLALIAGSFGAGLGVANLFTPQSQQQTPVAAVAQIEGSSEPNYIKTANVMSQGNNTVADIFKAVSPSVVSINIEGETVTNIFGQEMKQEGAGSGVIFSEDNDKIYVVTNYHVVSQATSATISVDDQNHAKANFVGGNESNDIAIISVKKADLTAAGITNYKLASFADSDVIQVGDAAIPIGNALGEGKTATLGIISAVNKKMTTTDNQILSVIQTDAAINPGNSGGALVSSDGKVMGINTSKYASTEVEGMGYAIPSNKVKEIINEIMSQTNEKVPFLGIEPSTVDQTIKEYYNFPSVGVYVNNVIANSSAYDAGLRLGDLIVAVNGKSIANKEDLSAIILSSKVGDTVTLTVYRSANEKGDVKVILKSAGLNF